MKFFALPNIYDSITIDGNVWKNDDFDIYDFDLEYEDNENVPQIFLGENGAGKSLYAQIVCYVAFVYHQRYKNPIQKHPKLNQIIKILDDLNIGHIYWDGSQPRDENQICIETSYTPNYLKASSNAPQNDAYKIDGIDIAISSLKKRFYCIKISPKAQKYFDSHKVLYYSNSQFPNNISFCSQYAASLAFKDVDYLFLLSQNNDMLDDIGNVSFQINLNKSYSSIFNLKEEWGKILNRAELQTFSNSFLRDYYEIDEYKFVLSKFYDMETKSHFPEDISYKKKYDNLVFSIKSSILYKLMNLYIRDNRFKSENFPSHRVSIQDFSLLDLFLFRFMQRKGFPVSCNLLIDGVDFDFLNSGKKYDIYLACLKRIYKSGKILFFLDEPENSHHIKIQESLMRNLPQNYQLNMITHSPFLVKGLSKYNSNYTIKLVYRTGNQNRDFVIESTKNIFNDINDISAEFFAYSPAIEKWNSINRDIDTNNFISLNDFYKKINELKNLF